MKTLFTALTMAAGLISFSATAQDATDGPSISGGVQMEVTATDDVAASIGNESKATQEMGAIDSGDIKGDTTMVVTGTNDVSASIGNKSCSDQKIGTIGAKNDC